MGPFLDAYLDHWAASSPDAPAFRIGNTDLSYAMLDGRANAMAAGLNGRNIGPGDRVGIYSTKSIDLPIAVYGVLKSGAAYVPLDPAAPMARTAQILNDCGVTCLITQSSRAKQMPNLQALVPGLTEIIYETTAFAPAHTSPKRQANDPAYILFTSGSTGPPKGILHSHRSARAYADYAAELYDIRQSDRMGNHSPLHFDMSKFEFFAGVSRGACVVMIPEMLTKLPASLSQLIEAERLTIWYSVPFALIQLQERGALDIRDMSALRWVIFAGEPMSPKHLNLLQKQMPDARFSNTFGPAELNVVTVHNLPKKPHDPILPVPIGKPCAHCTILIEDGQLLVNSPAMMRGYWRRPDLDASAIVMRPDAQGKPQSYYRTGDLVTYDQNGDLTFSGRVDRQIKLRGFRIELGEVEQALMAHDAVSEAAVICHAGAQSLTAFVTVTHGHITDTAALYEYLRTVLTPQAVPGEITIISEFLRTSTGKIDRKLLESVS